MERKNLPSNLVCHVFDGDGRRFARLFRATWRKVPAGERRKILAYWRDHGVPPRLELIASWSTKGRAVAQVDLLGHQIRFDARYVDRQDDPVIMFIIAHELVHVLQWATGTRTGRTSRQLEREANAKAQGWCRNKRSTVYLTKQAGTP